ncbi:MAG TPA: HAD family hydrolase [Polyangia bacterium]|nr:HAD family hydrolase [Polyangia bacterium]
MMPCVVLFDIDGTLLGAPSGGGPTAGFLSMNQACEDLTGKGRYERGVEFAGRTDLQIARTLLERAGEADPSRDRVDELLGRYLLHLEANAGAMPYALLGDPVGAVEALRAAGATAGLGTGNLARGARIKFDSAGIGELFDLELGGFGDDGDTRAEVLEVGVRRCDPAGTLPVVIIGDTIHDVQAALAIGAVCIGTPYQENTADVLLRAGAHAICEVLDASLADLVRPFSR